MGKIFIYLHWKLLYEVLLQTLKTHSNKKVQFSRPIYKCLYIGGNSSIFDSSVETVVMASQLALTYYVNTTAISTFRLQLIKNGQKRMLQLTTLFQISVGVLFHLKMIFHKTGTCSQHHLRWLAYSVIK